MLVEMPEAPRRFGQNQTEQNRKAYDKQRGSARQRGYTTEWDKLSKHWRSLHPWCVLCKEETGRLVHVEVVDHIKPSRYFPELMFDPDNLQSLCVMHNTSKAVEDERRYGNGVNRSTRTVVYGRPGSGKSTYVEGNRKPNDFVWDYDAVARTIFGTDDLSEENKRFTLRMLSDAMTQMRNGYGSDTWIIVTATSWAKEIAGKIGAELKHMDCSVDECVRRVTERDAPSSKRTDKLKAVIEWQ